MKKDTRGNWYTKSGYYYVRVHYYVDNERKSKDYRTGIKVDERKKKKLDREADKKVAEILANFVIPGSKQARLEQLFADLVAEWLEHQKVSKPASTYAGYQYAANDVMLYFRKLCPVKTIDLTSNMIERYQNWERTRRRSEYIGEYKRKTKYSDGSGIENTIKHRTTLIRSVLQFAKREGIVDRNVASIRDSQIDIPSPQRHEFEVLNVEEAKQILQMLKGEPLWFKVAITLALLLGLRRSEIIGLRVRDINLETGVLRVTHTITQQTVDGKNTLVPKPFTKNKQAKTFVLTESLKELVNELLIENHKNEMIFGKSYNKEWNEYLFRYPDGKLVCPNALTTAFAKYIKKNGFKKVRLHDLRHSCASILFANGTDLLTIQEVLGHQQLTTTISYTHKISEKKASALEEMSKQLWDKME